MIGQYPDDALRRKRIRRVKRLLRPMPRKTNLHRYPILKYFANYARKCTFLWEFKEDSIVRAIYIGWIIALIPMYGLQMITAFILCITLRANALIAMLLQWITNPITIAPFLYIQYKLGQHLYINLLNLDAERPIHIITSTCLGGFLLGLTGAITNHLLYKIYLMRYKKTTRVKAIR